MSAAVRVLQRSAVLSIGDFFAIFPIRVYLIAWLPRGVFQMAFYALLAQFVGGAAFASYALIGTSAQVTYQTIFSYAASSVVREQGSGTIPLLVASPTNPLFAWTGRNVAMLGHGAISGFVPFLIALPFLAAAPSVVGSLTALLLLLTIGFSAYTFAMILGSVGLRWRGYHNVLSALAGTAVTILCGAYVPRPTLPEWAQAVGGFLPATHGLAAVRSALAGASLEIVSSEAAREVTLGAAYLVIALVSLRYFLARARAAGTLDFH